MVRFAVVSNSPDAAGAEQSSSFVTRKTNKNPSVRRKPWFSAGGGRPSAPRARAAAASGCWKRHPDSPSGAMQANTSSRLPL